MMFGRRVKLPLLAAVLVVISPCSLAAKTHTSAHTKEARSAASEHKKESTAAHVKTQKAPAHKTSAKSHKSAHHYTKKSRKHRSRGQQAIDNERAKEIQTALVREHYLNGQPSGKWDTATQEAMRRYQAAQGWQTKVVPDSRALIRLGLGPDNDHLLNPESAMVTGQALHTRMAPQSAAASASPTPASDSSAPISTSPDLSSPQ